MNNASPERSLDQQRLEFSQSRFLAMPLAGTIAWLIVALAGLFLPLPQAALALFIATGMTVYLGMFISRFTGENFLDKTKPKNAFDALFFHTVAMSLLVYGIAIPFFLADPTSLPLTVGILAGLMWVPLSWMIRHWIGIFHGAVRTLLVVAVWYAFPADRFVAVPLTIVGVYLVSIAVLESRWRALQTRQPPSS